MKALLLLLLIAAPANANQFVALIAASAAATAPAPTPGPQPAPVTDECENCGGTGKVGDGTVFVTCPVCDGTGKKTTAAAVTPVAKPALKWDAKNHRWLSADGKRWASPGSTNWQPVEQSRRVWVPPVYETRCFGRAGCKNVMVKPGYYITTHGTSLQRPELPSYPSSPIGKRWRYNGGNITAAHLANPGGHHAHEHFDPRWLRTLSQSQLNALGSDSHNGHDHMREQHIVRTR